MSKPETLIDCLYRESFKPGPFPGWRSNVAMRNVMENARRMVADVPMSRFMADLSNEAFIKAARDRKLMMKIADSLRLQARLPHDPIWIEYWMREYQIRSAAIRGVEGIEPDETPLKEGWLIQQHPTLTTAYIMHSFTCNDRLSSDGFNVWTFPFAFAWRCDEGPLPWPSLFDVIGKEAGLPRPRGAVISPLLFGMGDYERTNVDCVISPLINNPYAGDGKGDYYAFLLREWTGALRRVWSLLATIDNLPVTFAAVRASKGFFARGKIRRPLDFHTITLKIPERKDTRIVARSAIAGIHHKRHEVRAHWRDDWRHPPSKTCSPHLWEPVDASADTIECSTCHGRQFMIHKHERGDASLGYVYHDYDLTH